MAIDLNDASTCIPAGTVAVVQLKLRPPGEMAAADGITKRTKNGDAEGLDTEITVIEGPYAKRKFFAFMMVAGSTDGQKSMADATKVKLKAIVDSARFFEPGDMSEATKAKRRIEWRDLDGIRFLCEIGVEPARAGFDERNSIAKVITRDMPQWGGRSPIEQIPPDPATPNRGGTPSAAPLAPAPPVKPAWAQ
jgi:hypothetical protein